MGDTATFTSKMSARHVLVIITGIMITFGCSALVFSTWSAFQAVVPDLLGVEKATWAFYITILYLAEAFSAPFIGKLLAKNDIRVVLSVSALLVGCGFLLISFAKALWAFYVAGLMMGLGEVGILWLAVPTLCNKWFNQKSGTIIGLCMAFTGLGGAFWLQVFNALYAGGQGMDVWTIYFIWGIAALVTSLPFTLLCIRSTPQECGQLPYGEPENKSGKPAGIDASKAMKSAVFYACFLFAGLINLLTIVAQQFPSYTKSLTNVPFDAFAVGVMMATVMMVAQAVFKLMLGVAADKNARATFVAAIVTGIAGILLVWFGTGSEAILYTGAAVYGFFFASCVVFVPVFVRQIFGQREYPEIYSRISLFVNIMGAVGPVFWAFLGSFGYSTLFMVAIVLLVLVFVLGWFCFARMKSVREQWTE
ncbi:MAG: MFS transporter [Denitrobacterium sp.]|jgi:MFS family permease|nr:MFS transporter [Denitrobacterium sp.]